MDDDATVVGLLRWLVGETEAEAAAYLCLQPGGDERLLVEPRGLPADDLGFLARQARHAIVHGVAEQDVNEGAAVTRWLGRGGSKILLLRGVVQAEGDEPLRFARFAMEWLAAARTPEGSSPEEHRVRMVPGVAYAEIGSGDPSRVRVLYGREADPKATRRAVEMATRGSALKVEELDAVRRGEEPRARLIDLSVNVDEHPSVDVIIDWKGQRLRGRGHGKATAGGRSYASAEAVADAMKPLLDSDVTIEGLYQADSSDGLNVLVAAVRVAGERYVGAVVSGAGDEEASGARAVLDALNRRLPHIAGKSGRI